MGLLRLFLRAPLAALLSLVFWLGTIAGNVVFFPRRAWPLRRASQRFFYRTWARLVCRVLGVRVELEGARPALPCLVVTNHLSYLDILVIASVLPARFVAKHEIRSWFFVGWMCRAVDTIFVDRSSRRDTIRVAREMAEGLRVGDAIVLFPEGTSYPGHRVGAFKPALLAPAAEAQLPVRFGAIHYATAPCDRPAYLSVSWWGEMPFGPHALELLQLSRIEARLRFGAESHAHADRKELAQRLHVAVCGLFEPMVDYEPIPPGRSPRAERPQPVPAVASESRDLQEP
jgi:1-acyl-sn-glycerol-3-phosphate acyltransferase